MTTSCACGCGELVQATSGRGPEPVYVNAAHRQRAYRERQVRKDIDDVVNWRPGDPTPPGARPPQLQQESTAERFGVEDVQKTIDWIGWIRTGSPNLAAKAAIVEDATGKTLVPTEIAVDVLQVAGRGVFRSLASVRPTTRAVHRAGLLTAAATGWGRLETGTVAADANVNPENPPQEIEVFDLLTLCSVGVDELSDTTENARAAIVEALGVAMRAAEDTAFAVGTAAGTPRGIVNATNLARVPAGNKIAVTASNTPTWAQLSSLPFLLDDVYRDNGVWLMHKTSAGKVAALPEATNFEPGPNGRGLLGYPVRILSSLPDPATAGTGDASILFADLASAYRIADRSSFTVKRLVERYADAGKVGLLATTRVGGDLVRPSAVAVYTQ